MARACWRGGVSREFGPLRALTEPRSRSACYADTRQYAESGWDGRSFADRWDRPLTVTQPAVVARRDRSSDAGGGGIDDPNDAGPGVAGGGADGPGRDGSGGANDTTSAGLDKAAKPAAAVERFDPERAGLPATGAGDAAGYLAEHRRARPWLAVADQCPPPVQRLFAAVDRGGGHAHIRHEGWVTEEATMRRAAYLQDPAQRDMDKRHAGIDGLKPGDVPHVCRSHATRFTDPYAFATAFARGAEHPKVRAALEIPFDPDVGPRPVKVPITELLGADGHRYCTGWQLEPVDGSMRTARDNRAAWVAARSEHRTPNVPEPRARPVRTFEGGEIVYTFAPNRTRDGYQIVTMYPRPVDAEQ